MTSYFCVSNRDINCFITDILSNLNNNNFCVILFYKTFIANNLTALFLSFFYLKTYFLFFVILLFQFPFLFCSYGLGNQIPKEPKINLQKGTIAFKIRWIEKNFLNQIKFIQYDFKKKHHQSFKYSNNFQKKIFSKKPTWTLLRI